MIDRYGNWYPDYYGQTPYQDPAYMRIHGQQFQQNAQAAQQPQPVQQQIQNGGFVCVRTEEEAYGWPIAPGVGMTFKLENAPVIIDKSRGFSPMDQPIVKVYDMIERVQPSQAQETAAAPSVPYAERSHVEALQRELDNFKADLEALKNQPIVAEIKRTTTKKKEGEE